MTKKNIISIYLLITIVGAIYSTEKPKNLFPIKKRLPGNSVKYEVAYIDYDGKLMIPFEYSWGSVFENGIAAVTKNKQDFLIDSNNTIIKEFPLKYNLFNGFSEGLCIIMDSETELYGYINYEGEIEISIQYTYAEDFSNGIAKVFKGKQSFYINKKNETVTQETKIQDTEYKIFFDERTKLKGLKNSKGEIIIPAKYWDLWMPTKCGLCVFANNVDNLSYGVINLNNEIIYPEGTFFEMHGFKNGMAVFSPRNNNGGYLREDGRVFYFKDY